MKGKNPTDSNKAAVNDTEAQIIPFTRRPQWIGRILIEINERGWHILNWFRLTRNVNPTTATMEALDFYMRVQETAEVAVPGTDGMRMVYVAVDKNSYPHIANARQREE